MTQADPTPFIAEPLNNDHCVDDFLCGEPELDNWLKRSAASSDGRNITRTHVWTQHTYPHKRVVAYYATMPYIVERASLTSKKGHNLTETIPAYLLARLALDESLHGRKLGSALLAEALRRLAVSSVSVGGRLIVVDAIDDHAVAFYEHHGFTALPNSPDRLTIRVKDVLEALAFG